MITVVEANELDRSNLPLYFTMTAAALVLGVSESAVRQQVKRGQLATVTIGGKQYIPGSILRIMAAKPSAPTISQVVASFVQREQRR